jgi:YD repeat-containing protein
MRTICAFFMAAAIGAISTSAYAGSFTYRYDSLGRLSEISYDSGAVVRYTYDAAGNRTSEIVTGTNVLSPQTKAALDVIIQLLLED